MLVGEHGRVIPFRHFKTLTIAVGIVLLLSLGALALLGFLHVHLRQQIVELQKSLDDTRAQTAKIRDEKDLYLTQLTALQKQNGELSKNTSAIKKDAKQGIPSEKGVQEKQKVEVKEQEPEPKTKLEPAAKPEPEVHWSADIRNFHVTYDNRQRILKAVFRIYNTSRPKKMLIGRTVVVFKLLDDPPIHWATSPVVPLRDGKPIGKRGKSFRVNNYRTETFRTLRDKYSAEYNIASIYIFTEQGELIVNKEWPFNIDYSPPAPAKTSKPEKKAPTSEPEKRSTAPVTTPNNRASTAPPESTAPATVEPESPAGVQQDAKPAPAPPSMETNEAPQLENNTQESQVATEGDDSPATTKDGSNSQTPAADPQPAAVGGVN